MVSIVITTFNGEKYLPAQLESILEQSYRDVEIIICDDGSANGTQKIIKQFAAGKENVSFYFNDLNLGVNKNFEQGFLRARGDFIAIADQDDLWLPEKIEEAMQLFTSPEILLVHSASVRFSGNNIPGKKYSSARLFTGSDILKLALRNSVSGHNIIFRKSLLQHALPFPAGTYYDWWLVQNAAASGRVAASNKVHVYQRAHDNNVTIKERTTANQTAAEYSERKIALDNFLRIETIKAGDRQLLHTLREKYLLLENKNYSAELFKFLMRYRNRLFFYKKGLLKYFSQRKAARRMSIKEDR